MNDGRSAPAIIHQAMLGSGAPATGHTLPVGYLEGTCPSCVYPEARGPGKQTWGIDTASKTSPTAPLAQIIAGHRADRRGEDQTHGVEDRFQPARPGDRDHEEGNRTPDPRPDEAADAPMGREIP